MIDIKGLRIVVAEDDDINMFIIMKTLTDNGHTGAEFTDGSQAWEYLCNHPREVDMVILDKMMSQMHGMEVVERMKGHAVLKNTPIIIQSGDAVPEKIKEAIDAGIDRYITKPFEEIQLLELINEVASERGLEINITN